MNNLLKLIRQYHGLKQVEVAKLTGMSQAEVSQKELGVKNISVDNLYSYARAFSMDVSAMFYILEHLDDIRLHESMNGVFSINSVEFARWINRPKIAMEV